MIKDVISTNAPPELVELLPGVKYSNEDRVIIQPRTSVADLINVELLKNMDQKQSIFSQLNEDLDKIYENAFEAEAKDEISETIKFSKLS